MRRLTMRQPALLPEPFFCHNCRQFVPHAQRTRRFWLCDTCWAAIMPAWAQQEGGGWSAETPEQYATIGAYWEWYGQMEALYPTRRGRPGAKAARRPVLRTTDSYWPYCECGQERVEYAFAYKGVPRSLFGGTRAAYCPTCEARRSVEGYMGMADRIHPDWDDEAWLDALYQMTPAAFKLGVLPDYWFELRRGVIPRGQKAQERHGD